MKRLFNVGRTAEACRVMLCFNGTVHSRLCTNTNKMLHRCMYHRLDSIQGTDYIATSIQGFLGQKLKI